MTHTRRILWQVGAEITETKHAEPDFYTILDKIQKKAPAIDAGDGIGFSWVQYRGHKKLKSSSSDYITRHRIEMKIYKDQEWEIYITEKIDRETKEVVSHEVRKKVLRTFTEEEKERYKQWVNPLKEAYARRKHKSLK